MNVKLQKVTATDLELVHNMQVKAFAALLEKYHDFDGNPGAETLEKIKQRFESPRGCYYFITDAAKTGEEEKVGVIRVFLADGDWKKVSPIFVLPQFRNKGYAQKAILLAEEIYGSSHWFLDTLKEEPALCHLYEKIGYKLSGKATKISDIQTLVEYRKG